MTKLSNRVIRAWVLGTLLIGCSSAAGHALDAGVARGAGGSSGGTHSSSGAGAGSVTGPSSASAGQPVPDALKLCGGNPCQCADGIDNDGDGVIDGFDPECTGPNDNDEGSFATGIPGDNRDPKWQDCFFDGNSGGGDDGCRYSTDCLTGKKAPSDPACAVTQHCLDFCMPRTPNGCDCFGCCTFRKADGSSIGVVISSKCDASHLDACDKCTPSTACQNKCGDCELCPGKTVNDLPASCSMSPPPPGSGGSGGGGSGGSDGGTPVHCDTAKACLSQSDCPVSTYCAFGCCMLIPPI